MLCHIEMPLQKKIVFQDKVLKWYVETEIEFSGKLKVYKNGDKEEASIENINILSLYLDGEERNDLIPKIVESINYYLCDIVRVCSDFTVEIDMDELWNAIEDVLWFEQ